MYLVTGATGHVGGAVARQLHEQGHSVRALVRHPSRAASPPASSSPPAISTIPASVAKAVTGVEAIFLMQVGTGTGQTKTMITAADDAAVPRIVLLSSAGARLLPLDANPMGAAFAAREQLLPRGNEANRIPGQSVGAPSPAGRSALPSTRTRKNGTYGRTERGQRFFAAPGWPQRGLTHDQRSRRTSAKHQVRTGAPPGT
jgi:NAD(P)-dependent dehydrogenase (short-subunit alcohol dehydrogenase family)